MCQHISPLQRNQVSYPTGLKPCPYFSSVEIDARKIRDEQAGCHICPSLVIGVTEPQTQNIGLP